MRRTLFVFPHDVAPVIQAGAAGQIAVAERDRVLREIAGAGIATDPVAWLAEVEAATLEALRTRGEATANELGADEPRLRTQMRFNVGKKYEGTVGRVDPPAVPPRDGGPDRARPTGRLVGQQPVPVDPDRGRAARTAIRRSTRRPPARRSSAAGSRRSGRATVADIRWWTGWTLAEVRRILGELDVVEVDLDGATGVVLADDQESTAGADPFAALPARPGPDRHGLDRPAVLPRRPWPAPLRHERQRRADRLVGRPDRGRVGPAARRRDRPPAPRGRRGRGVAAIEAERDRLRAWLGPARVTPRFRTLFERELAGGRSDPDGSAEGRADGRRRPRA